MKKYYTLELEICTECDVISTSSDVTTGGIKLPWETMNDANSASYQLLSFTYMNLTDSGNYEM